jgi:Ser/Thr protein kinase RdoA (MazF antagonist)
MEYLSTHMVGIVKPQKSKNDNLYELIEINEKKYILFLLEKAQGKIVDVNNPNEFNETLFFNLGMLMGDMHRLTVKYDGNTVKQDFEWTGSVNFYRYDNPILDEEVRLYQQKYYDEINMLPKDRENYGIIHWDIHTDNFFVDNGNIKLFDFDACQFNWYAADIASAIFFMVLKGAGPMTHKSEKERTDFAETYITSYLKGYLQTNTISEYWIRKIDLFIKYQMCDEYLSAQHFWSGELLQHRDWYMEWHKEKIINDLPYVFVDYDKIINRIFKK